MQGGGRRRSGGYGDRRHPTDENQTSQYGSYLIFDVLAVNLLALNKIIMEETYLSSMPILI